MQLLDITKFDTDFDFLSKAKTDIENKWILDKTIEQNQSFTDFIKRINVSKFIFMIDDDHVIPFNFIQTENNSYIFYCGTENETIDNNATNYIANVIMRTEYNLYALTEITSPDLALNERIIPEYPYFIIDGKNYIFKE